VLAVFPNAGLAVLVNSLLCLAARSNASVELLLAAYKEKLLSGSEQAGENTHRVRLFCSSYLTCLVLNL